MFLSYFIGHDETQLSWLHQCSKDFWPRLFSSFCLGFRPEAYWDETKRRNLWSQLQRNQSYRRTFLLRVYENWSHIHAPAAVLLSPTAPPTCNNAQNCSVASTQSTMESPFTHIETQQQHLHRDAPAAAHHRATMLHCTCDGAPHHDNHNIRTNNHHYLHHAQNNRPISLE